MRRTILVVRRKRVTTAIGLLAARPPVGNPMPIGAGARCSKHRVGAIDLARVTLEQEGIDYLAREPAARSPPAADDKLGRWMGAGVGAVALFVLRTTRTGRGELLADLQKEAGPRPAGETTASADGVSTLTGIEASCWYRRRTEARSRPPKSAKRQFETLVEHLERDSEQDSLLLTDAPTTTCSRCRSRRDAGALVAGFPRPGRRPKFDGRRKPERPSVRFSVRPVPVQLGLRDSATGIGGWQAPA